MGKGVAPSVADHDELRDRYETASEATEQQPSWLQRYAQPFTPCFYVRNIVNSNKQSPTAIEAEKVISLLRQYVSGGINSLLAVRNWSSCLTMLRQLRSIFNWAIITSCTVKSVERSKFRRFVLHWNRD